ncbi:MAG TPA: two-component system response regulator [Lachnospiraceae bacterium]|nr:two-component system response regulator [Lachnospiraceae bacterium]
MAKIMIVDDSKTSRKIIKTVCEENGYEIAAEAVNGEDAVAKYKEVRPDVVTLDITMPVLDGISALKDIIAYDKDAKVIMITAAGQKGKVVECVEAGAKDFLTKPFDKKEIIKVINKVAGV